MFLYTLEHDLFFADNELHDVVPMFQQKQEGAWGLRIRNSRVPLVQCGFKLALREITLYAWNIGTRPK